MFAPYPRNSVIMITATMSRGWDAEKPRYTPLEYAKARDMKLLNTPSQRLLLSPVKRLLFFFLINHECTANNNNHNYSQRVVNC